MKVATSRSELFLLNNRKEGNKEHTQTVRWGSKLKKGGGGGVTVTVGSRRAYGAEVGDRNRLL